MKNEDIKSRVLPDDNLTECPICNSDACYHTKAKETNFESYMCFTCGYSTSTQMKEGEEIITQTRETSAELIKDLEIIQEGYVWYPSVMNIPEQGIVFPDGSSKDQWMWASMKAVKVKEEEKEKYPVPGKKGEYYTYRIDDATLKHFDKMCYMDALEEIGMFEK
jgi:Zn ribbon nucleic-acid-binding protein